MNYQITVVDDHPIVAEGICTLLAKAEGAHCTSMIHSEEIVSTLPDHASQLYIIDLSMPDINGFRLIELIQQKSPVSKILIYTMHEEPWIIEQLAQHHIQGAVSKSEPIVELIQAVNAIRHGQKYFSTSFAQLNHDKHSDETNGQNAPVLSKREREVLHCITQGHSTGEIAELLFLSINTIHTYRKRLMSKLNAKNMAELVYKGKDFF